MAILGRGLEIIPNNGIIKPLFLSKLPDTVTNGQVIIITSQIVPKVIFGVSMPTVTTGLDNHTVFIPITDVTENPSVNISNNNELVFDLKFGQAKILVGDTWNDVDGYVGVDSKWVKFGYGGIDKNTLLLLDFDSEINKDSSDYNRISVPSGSPSLNTQYKKFGESSGYFPASAWIDYADVSPFNFGSRDFTVDWWEYRPAAAAAGSGVACINGTILLFAHNNTASTSSVLAFYASSNGSGWDICSAVPMGITVMNQWVHRAVVRKNGVFTFYQNGVQYNSYANSSGAIFSATTQPFRVGACSTSSCTCYLDEFRVSDVARWTENFIPPNTPYTK